MSLAAYGNPLERALQRELRHGERVLWRGRMLRRLSLGHFVVWVFAVPWTAFSLLWTTMAFAGAEAFEDGAGMLGYAFPLFGTPFIAVGLGMLSLPLLPLFGANRTLFAVTNQRLIRIFLGPRLWTKSVEGGRIGEIERRERPDGSGTLQITVGSHRDSDGDRVIDRFGIGEVANVMEVEERVRQMAAELNRSNDPG